MRYPSRKQIVIVLRTPAAPGIRRARQRPALRSKCDDSNDKHIGAGRSDSGARSSPTGQSGGEGRGRPSPLKISDWGTRDRPAGCRATGMSPVAALGHGGACAATTGGAGLAGWPRLKSDGKLIQSEYQTEFSPAPPSSANGNGNNVQTSPCRYQ